MSLPVTKTKKPPKAKAKKTKVKKTVKTNMPNLITDLTPPKHFILAGRSLKQLQYNSDKDKMQESIKCPKLKYDSRYRKQSWTVDER
jgi:hypothetical protein